MISFKEPQFIGTSLVIISTEEYRELLALIENLESFFAVETAKEEETEFIDVFFKKVEEYRKKDIKIVENTQLILKILKKLLQLQYLMANIKEK